MTWVTKEVLTLKSLTWSSHREKECGYSSPEDKKQQNNSNLREKEERVDGEERWGSWFEHPHMHCTHKSKHLGSLLASPLLLPYPHPPAPPNPARAVRFYLSCVQTQASVKRAEESATASALSGGRETRASITCNIELLGHFCASDPEQMDGETVGRRYPEVSWLIHTPSTGGRSEEKRKSGLRIPVENMAKSLSEAQSPVSRNSWKEAHFKPVLKRKNPGKSAVRVEMLLLKAHLNSTFRLCNIFRCVCNFAQLWGFFFSCTAVAGKEDATSANVFKFTLNITGRDGGFQTGFRSNYLVIFLENCICFKHLNFKLYIYFNWKL